MALRDEKFSIPEELIIEDLDGQDRKIRQNALDLLNVMTWYDWDPTSFVASGGAQALISCLEDPDEEARRLAAFLIGYLAEACGVGSTGIAGAVPLLMKLFDGSSVSFSKKILSRGTRNLRVAAGNTLVKIGPPAVEALTVACHNPNRDVRFNAARALGEIRDPKAVESLLDLLKDQNRTVRLASARALGFIKDERAVEPLSHALGDRTRMVRNYIAWALGEIGDERAVPALQKAYKHALMEGDLSGQYAINAALEEIESSRYRKYRE
jgi:HEAT repeat protein